MNQKINDLRKLAKEQGIENYMKMTKLELFSALNPDLVIEQTEDKGNLVDSKGVRYAIVLMRGKYEIRRYTPETHGNNFIELANEFAGKHVKKEYTVSLLEKV